MPQQDSWLQVMDSFQLPDPPLIKTQKEHTHSLPHGNKSLKQYFKKIITTKTNICQCQRLLFLLHGLFFLLHNMCNDKELIDKRPALAKKDQGQRNKYNGAAQGQFLSAEWVKEGSGWL